MSLQTNLAGRIRNTDLPKSHALMPVFEAIVNSIHAIEETKNLEDGKITLDIIRSQEVLSKLDNELSSPIVGFTITDNGCGFTEKNFISFDTLDSDYKLDKGCRGLGRLIWLKVFDVATVNSVFKNDEGHFQKRQFTFTANRGIDNRELLSVDTKQQITTIILKGVNKKYLSNIPKKIESIADSLLEHILWYFVREGGAPEVFVKDNTEEIHLNSLYDKYMKDATITETIQIKGYDFCLTHIKFRNTLKSNHKLAWCASNRLVKEEVVKSDWVPGLYGSLEDNNGEFYYNCYITSDYLTERVRSERTGFNIEEGLSDMLDEISFNMLRQAVLEKCNSYLKEYLIENIKEGHDRLTKFVSDRAPQYRPILGYLAKNELIIDPSITDAKLDLLLHGYKYKLENQILSEGHTVMQPKENEEVDDYKTRLNEYLHKVGDIKKSDLAKYVSHRKVIIDLLSKSINMLDDGKYEKEHVIHELIMPMQADTDDTDGLACNLWLLDERLAFHHYLASDKTINSMPITGDVSNLEPDLISLKVFDNPILVSNQKSPTLASITVIEIKRPMRNDVAEGRDPVEQSLNYLEKVREGRVTTKNGRPINGAQDLPGYCYVLCDLTNTMVKRLKKYDLTMTSDGMGYFGYNKAYKAYIEVMSFDQLVKSATERNSAFFTHLGIPSF